MKSGFFKSAGDDQLSDWTEKKLQSTSQSQTCSKKFMATVWWSAANLIHYSFLNPGETITFKKHAQQINEMHQKLQRLQPVLVNRKGPVPLHNNAQRHVAQPALLKVNTLHYQALPRPPYSPGLLPTDSHFFEHLDKFCRENASTTSKKMPLQPQPENAFPLFGKIILGVGTQQCLEDGCSPFMDPGLQLQHFQPPATPVCFRLVPQSELDLPFLLLLVLNSVVCVHWQTPLVCFKSEVKERVCKQPRISVQSWIVGFSSNSRACPYTCAPKYTVTPSPGCLVNILCSVQYIALLKLCPFLIFTSTFWT